MTTKNASLFTIKECLDRAKRWREENPEEAKKLDTMMEQHKDEVKMAGNLVVPLGRLDELKRNPKSKQMAYRSVGRGMNFDVEVRTFPSRDTMKKFLEKEKNWGAMGHNSWKALEQDRVPANMLAYPSYQEEDRSWKLPEGITGEDLKREMAKGKVASSENMAAQILSRFEEGKPADPTENMSPEDAKKWREMNEEHKDNFKTAATYPVLHSVASGDCKLIDRLVSQRMEVDWVTDPRDETYIKHSKEEGFFESYLPRVKKELQEVNDLIREATSRLLKRLIAFEKAGLSEFEELGYSVTIEKPTSLTSASDWADYDFKQNISVSDKVFKGTTSLRLTWGFRDFVSMSVENDSWTHFDSDSRPKATFASMVLTIKDRIHDSPRDWNGFVVWRKKQMAEKGLRQANTVTAQKTVARLRGIEGTMASEKELVLSRFEEGKPADPTENMSAEDAKEWERMNEEHKDEFKAASTIRVATRFLTADQDKSAPSKVDDYFKKVKDQNPSYTDEQAWATAWSIYCAYKKPGDPSCHQEEYFPGRKKEAGWSHAVDTMSVLFVEGRKPVPFNIDTIKKINTTFIPVVGDDGETHDANLSVMGHQTSGPLTFYQEKAGMRRETLVDIRFPVDEGGPSKASERTAFVALVKLGKSLGFNVEPVRPGYKPQTRK